MDTNSALVVYLCTYECVPHNAYNPESHVVHIQSNSRGCVGGCWPAWMVRPQASFLPTTSRSWGRGGARGKPSWKGRHSSSRGSRFCSQHQVRLQWLCPPLPMPRPLPLPQPVSRTTRSCWSVCTDKLQHLTQSQLLQ